MLMPAFLDVGNLDRVQPAPAFHKGTSAQVSGDRAGIERGRHHDHLQVRPNRLPHAADHGQGQVAIETPLVKLVEDDHHGRLEERIVLKHPQQDPFGDHLDPRCRPHAAVESHLVADLVPQSPAPLCRHPSGTGPHRHPPGLQNHDCPLRRPSPHPRSRVERGSSFPPPWALESRRPRRAQLLHHVRQDTVDRQGSLEHERFATDQSRLYTAHGKMWPMLEYRL